MEKYKICPSCGAHNAPALFECLQCETDLTGVKITDEETQRALAEEPVSQDESGGQMVRLCECGEKNAPNARKCSACGEDISDITPTPDTQQPQADTASYILSSLDGQYAFHVPAGETVIGRENVMQEYLGAKSYVSRTHAKLNLDADGLYIENLSTTNFTYVNNQRIAQRVKLQDGDELGLGGTNRNGQCQEQAAYFLVRIGQCT
jgi:ribosomal protein L40E